MQRSKWLISAASLFLLLVFMFPAGVQAEEVQVFGFMPAYSEKCCTVSILLGDKEVSVKIKPILNQTGTTMILAEDLASLLDLRLDWVDNNQLQLSDEQIKLSFRDNEYIFLRNDTIISGDTLPFKSNAGIFIPLRQAAEEFGITVDYKAETKTVLLYSQPPTREKEIEPLPDIEFPQNIGNWGAIKPGSELASLWEGYHIKGGYFTRLTNSPPNRTNNIILACNQINGTEIKPDEVFSFNDVVGQRTVEKGYRSASVFVGKEIVPGIGGGICQVSSTLYNSALESGLEIVQRYAHTLPVTYIPTGRDATVLWGGADLKFKNNTDSKLKILTGVYGNYVAAVLVSTE